MSLQNRVLVQYVSHVNYRLSFLNYPKTKRKGREAYWSVPPLLISPESDKKAWQ